MNQFCEKLELEADLERATSLLKQVSHIIKIDGQYNDDETIDNLLAWLATRSY